MLWTIQPKQKELGPTCKRIKCPLVCQLSSHTKISNIQHFQLVTSWLLRKSNIFFLTHFRKFTISVQKHCLKNLKKFPDVCDTSRNHWHKFQIFWISTSARSSKSLKSHFRAPTVVAVHHIQGYTLKSNSSCEYLSNDTHMSWVEPCYSRKSSIKPSTGSFLR